MLTIYTIGYTRKSLRQFIGLLQEAGVDAVIDVRLRNTSQLAASPSATTWPSSYVRGVHLLS